MTHCRLADADAPRGARDAPLCHQCIEGNQEIEVEEAQISHIDYLNRNNRFDNNAMNLV
jgi:hypothetical protein